MAGELLTVGLTLYGATLVLLLAVICWALLSTCSVVGLTNTGRILPWSSPKTLFVAFCICFLTVRFSWFVAVEWFEESLVNFIISRISFLLLFSAFSLLICYWAHTLAGKSRREKAGFWRVGTARWIFIGLNGVLYLSQLGVILYFSGHPDRTERNSALVVKVNSLFVSAISCLLCLLFLGYALFWFITKKRNLSQAGWAEVKFCCKVFTVVGCLALCFFVRSIFFAVVPFTGKAVPPRLYYTMAYFVPELLPVILVGIIMILSVKVRMDAKKSFILWRKSTIHPDKETRAPFEWRTRIGNSGSNEAYNNDNNTNNDNNDNNNNVNNNNFYKKNNDIERERSHSRDIEYTSLPNYNSFDVLTGSINNSPLNM
jgi:hypothetical protein